MKELISFDKELRQAIRETVTVLSKAVKSTLGPSGTNVGVLSDVMLPVIVNDGVTVSKKIKFEDPLKKYIANILKTVSQNTDNIAGDGTTTSITLAEAIILKGLDNIEANFSQVDLAKGIRKATLMVLEKLEENKTSISNDTNLLEHVASISANNDKELGKVISEAFSKVGVNGQIEVTDSKEDRTYIELVPGMTYNSGYESNMFTNTDKGMTLFEDCNILIYEGKLTSIVPLIGMFKNLRNENKSLLIIADDFDKVCIEDIAANKVQGQLKVCAVKSPGYGVNKEKSLEDIALVTGASIISNRLGTNLDGWDENNWDENTVGRSKTVKVYNNSFTLLTEPEDTLAVSERVKELKKDSKSLTGTEKQETLERIAKLSNGAAVMYVHGNSPVEIVEKKYRIEDAINATRASLEEGIVPGGGVTLLRISNSLKMPKMDNQAQEIGFNILISALKAPMETIVMNSGEKTGEVMINEVLRKKKFNYGYDAKTKTYGDMIEKGIIDPVKVTRAALVNASSVSQLVLTMNCAIY